MLTFSSDGVEADRQMRAVIFYLTTFGYIDGDFDEREQEFVRGYIRRLVKHRVDGAVSPSETALREELTQKYGNHFTEVFDGIRHQVQELFTEAVADGENHQQFVESKLKLRCFEIFQSFDERSQELLMDTIDDLIHADGEVHPAEIKFRAELANLLEDDLGVELLEESAGAERLRVEVRDHGALMPSEGDDPFLEPLEIHYSREPSKLQQQLADDLALVDKVTKTLQELRWKGAGKLDHKKTVREMAPGTCFLDGHIYVESPKPGRAYELTVLGDLHGCYSCLKAVLSQSRFFEKLAEFRKNPEGAVCPKLVFLGDYIDRGIFSYHGVLRAVMQLLTEMPEHVYVLRGNHEYYFQYKGKVYGGVKPAEAINTLQPHTPDDRVFEQYMAMFENLPNMLFFERFLFVHGGIARDRLLKERFHDLASLNDPDIRFQMMWSDPSTADVIPAALQEQSSRFPFGRLQCQAFLQKVGCHSLIRGHEKIDEGFRRVYDDENQLLISLFSAGGNSNSDLPPDSSYRSVTPMALTLRYQDGESEIQPWPIEYEAFNDPRRNAFFKAAPEIEHRA
jgi:hypothetical protein